MTLIVATDNAKDPSRFSIPAGPLTTRQDGPPTPPETAIIARFRHSLLEDISLNQQ
jgi:hypothetical protein